jgi:hypothetical protein
MSSNNDNNKRAKMESDFDALKTYLLQAPLPCTHPAMQAVLEGLETARKRQERDWKLQEKFAKEKQREQAVGRNTNMTSSSVVAAAANSSSAPTSITTRNTLTDDPNSTSSSPMNTSDDWHDVAADDSNHHHYNHTLGAMLAKHVIAALALGHVRVATPLQALTVALHAAMRSSLLEFGCTGLVVETTTKTSNTTASSSSSGFAEPIRELPKCQLLPSNWDPVTSTTDCIVLRYRKDSIVGALLLRVEQAFSPSPSLHDNTNSKNNNNSVFIRVTLLPEATSKEPNPQLEFPLEHHFNLDSFQRAVAATALLRNSEMHHVEPALHYKSLAELLDRFCSTFDLGQVREEAQALIMTDDNGYSPMVNNEAGNRHHPILGPSYYSDNKRHNGNNNNKGDIEPPEPYRVPSTLPEAFPQLHHYQPGQFEGDLWPDVGFMGGGRSDNPPGGIGFPGPGNLMGPDHPLFTGDNMHRVGPNMGGGPGTMQPRYDPIGPAFGPTDVDPNDGDPLRRLQVPGPHNSNRRGPPGGTGVPNNSLLRPPNNLNNNNNNLGGNMFM